MAVIDINLSEPKAFVSEETKRIEVELFIEAMYRLCGYDVRKYSRPSLIRLIESLALKEKLPISALIPQLAHDPTFRRRVLDSLTVSYSTLFRDPVFFTRLKETIFPRLMTFPRLSIWVPGCASGEEVYSLVIALHEANLLERSQIYATDINLRALEQASSGIVRAPINSKTVERYNASGGTASLSDYFIVGKSTGDRPKLRDELLERISFKRHDLIQEASFISPQLVLCRNVFIYFDRELQDHVLKLLVDSLVDGGFLATGLEESIDFCPESNRFNLMSRTAKIYQKKY